MAKKINSTSIELAHNMIPEKTVFEQEELGRFFGFFALSVSGFDEKNNETIEQQS